MWISNQSSFFEEINDSENIKIVERFDESSN
jgi:hypothetical protein